jgi:hypothetical protein
MLQDLTGIESGWVLKSHFWLFGNRLNLCAVCAVTFKNLYFIGTYGARERT